MNVLVACEESQRVCIAFRKKGHQALWRKETKLTLAEGGVKREEVLWTNYDPDRRFDL